MGPADPDICSWSIFMLILIPIYFDRHIGHLYRYFFKTDIWPIISENTDMLIFSPLFQFYCRYLANTNIADNRYRYRYADTDIQFADTDISVSAKYIGNPIYRSITIMKALERRACAHMDQYSEKADTMDQLLGEEGG
jgi:hypothetical protein